MFTSWVRSIKYGALMVSAKKPSLYPLWSELQQFEYNNWLQNVCVGELLLEANTSQVKFQQFKVMHFNTSTWVGTHEMFQQLCTEMWTIVLWDTSLRSTEHWCLDKPALLLVIKYIFFMFFCSRPLNRGKINWSLHMADKPIGHEAQPLSFFSPLAIIFFLKNHQQQQGGKLRAWFESMHYVWWPVLSW